VEEKKKKNPKGFQKGNQYGKVHSKGRPKFPVEQKMAQKLTRTKFRAITMRYLGHTRGELESIARNPETPAIDMVVISILIKAIKGGDEKRLNWFLEQLFGKLTENKALDVNVTGKVETVKTMDFSQLSPEELENMEKMVKKC
jgi:hypothetical protein